MVPPDLTMTKQRIAGLDSLRFFCALTVVFYHGSSPPLFDFVSRETYRGRIVHFLYECAFNGEAAVIVFFVISGFCIHYPYASGRKFDAGAFLISRGVRILVPVGAYLLLLHFVPFIKPLLKVILWSIWCELTYYAWYPVLRRLFAKSSPTTVLLWSCLPAALVIGYAIHTYEWSYYFNAGGLTWLAGLPCWLLGCLLAESVTADSIPRAVPGRVLWSYRLGAVGLGFVACFAMRYFHFSSLISLQFFALFSYWWLEAEVRAHLARPANRVFEQLGSLTFSIYLMHVLAKCWWDSFMLKPGILGWAAELSFVLLVGAAFYIFVERPSHRLAQSLSRRGFVRLG